MDIKKQIALSIYEGVGGNPNQHFDTVDEIYAATDAIYKSQDYRQDVESLNITLDSNGTYIYDSRDVQGYKPVEINVNVDVDSYYNSGYENGVEEQKNKLESITIESNGTYIKEDGYNEVKVALDIPKTKIYNGFRFVSEGNNDYKLIKDIDFSLYDWSGVYELDNFFAEFYSNDGGGLVTSDFDNFIENFNGEMLSCCDMFYFSNALKEAPNFGDKTKNCDNMNGMFYKCTSLTSIPQLDTSNVIDMGEMFHSCDKLTSIPLLDTSNVTNMSYMFHDCGKLTSIPQFDTSKVTNMSYMFDYCDSLTSIPQIDTSNVTNMQNMFNSCSSLTTIPLLDTSKVSEMRWFFYDCNSLTDLGGFKDLGKQSSVNGINDYFLHYAPNLTHESLMNVIYNLYDRKANGLSTLSVKFGSTNLNKLTDEEKAIAINKGWNLI